MEFWQKFTPAITAAAKAAGKPKFFQFGEVYDSQAAAMSKYTTEGSCRRRWTSASRRRDPRPGQSDDGLTHLFAGDDYYTDTDCDVYWLPTFLGNHDMGRIGYFLAVGGSTGEEMLQRTR